MTNDASALDIQFSKRFSSNIISNVIYFILNAVIGFFLAPFFLNTLGPAAYGLIPLATTVSSYVTLLVNSLNSSVSRFLTIELQMGDKTAANKTFNTSLFGTLGFCLLLLPVAIVLAIFAPVFFNIDAVAATDVILLFGFVFIAALIRMWGSTFQTTLFAYNRLDLRNCVELTNLLVQVGLIIGLFALLGPSLPLVGISYFTAAVVSRLLSRILSKKTCPFLSLHIRNFVWDKFKEIGHVAIWMGFNALGALLYSQIGLMIVNMFVGAVPAAQYSLCLVWGGVLISISGLVTSVFTPMIYSYYSQRDRDGLLKFTKFTLKIVGLVMVLPIALVCIFAPQLMTVWVGQEYAFLWSVIWILLLPIVTQMQASCIAPINAAYKRVVVPAVLNFIAGLINLILGLILTIGCGFGLYGVAIAYMVSMFFLTGFGSPFYNAYVLKAPKFTYFKYMVFSVFLMLFIVLIGEVITYFIPVTALWQIILLALAIAIGYYFILVRFVLKRDEKTWIRACVPNWLAKRIPKWIL